MQTWVNQVLGVSPTTPKADLNGDGDVNVLDVQLCVNVFLDTETTPKIVSLADVNGDSAVNAQDAQIIANLVLGA